MRTVEIHRALLRDRLVAHAARWGISVDRLEVRGDEWPLRVAFCASNGVGTADLEVETESSLEYADRRPETWADGAMNVVCALVDEQLLHLDETVPGVTVTRSFRCGPGHASTR